MRRGLALLAVAFLALTAGCAGILGGGSIPDEQLGAQPPEPYTWNASTEVHIEVANNATFQAVYRVPGNRSQMKLYRTDGFGGRNPIPVRAVRYRFPNGTVINGSQFEEYGGSIKRTNSNVIVTFPDGHSRAANNTSDNATNVARFGFVSDSTPKRFSLPTFIDGSYEVVLPPDRRVGFFLFGSVVPGGFNKSIDPQTSRLHIRWQEVTADTVMVRFYLQRDLLIFGVVVALLAVIGVLGAGYYVRQIRELREQREAYGPDVDTDDEFDQGPPPGMG